MVNYMYTLLQCTRKKREKKEEGYHIELLAV